MEEMTLQELLEKENAILIKNMDENPSLKKWQEMGGPKVLILADHWEDYELYDDIGYGFLFLLKDGKIIDRGRNFVQDPLLKVVGLGPYYGYEPSSLFVRPQKERKE